MLEKLRAVGVAGAVNDVRGNVAVTIAVQQRDARQVRLGAITFQRDLQLHPRQLAAERREMGTILRARRDADIGIFHQNCFARLRRHPHMLQRGALPQHDFQADIAEICDANAFHQGQRRARLQHQKRTDMTGSGEFQLQRFGNGTGNAEGHAALRQRQRSRAHHIAVRLAEMCRYPSRRIGLRQVEALNACRHLADMQFGLRRADSRIAQRRTQVGVFPLLDSTMRHAVTAEDRGGFGFAVSDRQRHATSFTICS